MSEEEVAADDGKVEELAEDKPAKVDIVPEVIQDNEHFYFLLSE